MLTKFKAQAAKVLKVIRIFDTNGLISLTNLTMMLVIYKVAMAPVLNMGDITALALGVLGYQAKRLVEK